MNSKLTGLAQRFRELKDQKEAHEETLKAINKELEDLAVNQLPTAMDENEIEKFTVEGVGTIYQQVEVYANVKKENQETFFAWLRENGHGDLVKETVYPQTLKSFAKEQIEAGVDLPDYVTAHKVPTARLRRK